MTIRRPGLPALLPIGLLALVVVLVAGCGEGAGGGPPEGEEPAASPSGVFSVEALDLPAMEGLPERARSELGPVRAEVERLADLDDPPEAELGEAVGRLGMLYQRYELPDPALACFRAAGRLAREQPRWPYYAGYVLAGRGELEAAAVAFERARELDPEATWTLLRLADVELDRGRVREAEELYRRVLELRPESPAARYGLGRAALAAGEPERAVAELERVLDAEPGATRVHHLLAQAYRRAGREEEARRALEHAGGGEVPRHDPPTGELLGQASGGGLAREAQMELRAGRREEGEELLRAALAEDPDDLTARYNLAAILHRTGRREEAEEQYRGVLDRDPAFTRARFGLGTLLAEGGRLAAAVAELGRAVREAPDFVQARLNLAAALARLGRWDEAVSQYSALLALDPNREEVRLLHANALLEAGRPRAAATAFGDLVAARPERTLPRLKEAEAWVAAGDPGEARRRLEAGLAARPRSGELTNALARLLAAAPDPGVRDPGRAVELAGSLFEARPDLRHGRTLAMALAAAGRYPEAADLQRRLLGGASGEDLEPGLRARLEAELDRYRRGEPPVYDPY